jgi:hypothetical protein
MGREQRRRSDPGDARDEVRIFGVGEVHDAPQALWRALIAAHCVLEVEDRLQLRGAKFARVGVA